MRESIPMVAMEEARSKKDALLSRMGELGSLMVAYSGGVDSTFLLALAQEAIPGNVLAVTARSIIHPAKEIAGAVAFAAERGIRHILFPSQEMSLPDFLLNGPDRCYYCKRLLFEGLRRTAEDEGIRHIAHGANRDDLGDHRPGARAARELGIIAPLLDVGLGKGEIRLLSKEMGLTTWDKPAMACLATRIPYGEPITEEKLRMVEAAEEYLSSLGFLQVRVRHHGPVARVEVEGARIERLMAPGLREKIVSKLRDIGFLHVTVDMEGYVPGSLNRAISEGNKA
jgi:uncharacterized protein